MTGVSETSNRPWHRFYPEGISPQMAPLRYRSIGEMVRDTAGQHTDEVAFSNLGSTLTFAELDRLSDRFAAHLQQLGLGKGDRIVMLMPNLLQYPVASFGALKAGLIVINANPLYTASELEKVFEDAEPVAIVVLANSAHTLEPVLPRSTVKHVFVTEVGDLFPMPKRLVVNTVVSKVRKLVPSYRIPNAQPFRKALAGKSRPTEVDLGPDDVAFLQYTGGTTGKSKAAVLSHSNLLSNQEQFAAQMRRALGDGHSRIIAALPVYHVFSMTVNCLGFFHLGQENVFITDPRDIAGLIKTLDTVKPEAIILVNTLAAGLLNHPDFATLDFSNLKLTIAGGMAVHTSVAQRWKEVTGNDLLEGYGLTEASPVVSVNPPTMPPRPGSIGIPLPSTDVQIRDDDGRVLGVGEPGELAVRGPQVMQGYWKQPEETARVLDADGWLLTGDTATIDEDGYLRIVDRKKDMIVVSGFNVYPGEIEDVATMHPKVAEAGVIGVADEKSGEAPKLFVVRKDPSLTEAELRAHLKEHLVGYKRPRQIVFKDELPKSNVGKVLRRELRDSD